MVKKRRLGGGSSGTPAKVKAEGKSPFSVGGDDLMLARNRLQGALQGLMVHSDDESDTSQEETPPPVPQPPPPPPPPPPPTVTSKPVSLKNRRKKRTEDPAFHHTYVMKLFDRSVDLAQFTEDTPLYPICRAWMANEPRNQYNSVKHRSPSPEIKTEREDSNEKEREGECESEPDGDIKDVYSLPPPTVTGVRMRVPKSDLPHLKGITFNYDSESPLIKDMLLRAHLQRWVNIRKKWIAAAQQNEARYEKSGQILSAMYKKAQKAFQ